MNPPTKTDMPLRQFLDQVYAPLRLIGTTGSGHRQYRTLVNRLAAFLEREPMLSDLNETTVAAFLANTVATGRGPVTANSRLRIIRTLHRFARRKKFPVPDLDDVDKLPVPKRLPKAWTMAEMETLLAACERMTGRLMGVPESRYWKALILAIYDTGLRISAAREIRWNEIDFATGVLFVPAERMKNLVEQTFTLHPQTIEAIVATLPPRRRLVFSWPFSKPHVLWDRLRKLLKLAGLPDDCKSMFHRLRRTCATHLASVAGPAAAIRQLGHQNETTIARYIDPRFMSHHQAALSLPRPGWNGAPAIVPESAVVPTYDAPLSPVTERYSADDLAGAGEDVFERLTATHLLTDRDVLDAIEAMGITREAFDDELRQICWGRVRMRQDRDLLELLGNDEPLPTKIECFVRMALGISHWTRNLMTLQHNSNVVQRVGQTLRPIPFSAADAAELRRVAKVGISRQGYARHALRTILEMLEGDDGPAPPKLLDGPT
jgi:integrase